VRVPNRGREGFDFWDLDSREFVTVVWVAYQREAPQQEAL
jgi:hypothetical protein